MKTRAILMGLSCGILLLSPGWALAQTGTPKPWGRVSFFTNSSRTAIEGVPVRVFNELTSSVTFQAPEMTGDGLEYGLDLRHSTSYGQARPDRASIYEGFVGARFAGGLLKARVGHVWLNDLGALGSVAGAVIEAQQPRELPNQGGFRAGLFAGLEPNIMDAGYAQKVKKGGVYVAYDGNHGRRHVVGMAVIRNSSLTERSVLTVTNYVPVGPKLFIYQASEYDVRRPAGQGKSGLAYFFSNVRYTPVSRIDVQGTYNRGRSIDARTLSDDVLSGRPLTAATLNGFLYESLGGRVTVEVIPRVRVYAGYARDRNDRDDDPTGRVLFGAYASNIGGSGLDVAASNSLIRRPDGSYQSRYVSMGRQIGRRVYATVDYSTSLSVVRYSRSDGITVELAPQTSRLSGSANVNLTRTIALLATIEHTLDDQSQELRLMTGLTYRFR